MVFVCVCKAKDVFNFVVCNIIGVLCGKLELEMMRHLCSVGGIIGGICGIDYTK